MRERERERGREKKGKENTTDGKVLFTSVLSWEKLIHLIEKLRNVFRTRRRKYRLGNELIAAFFQTKLKYDAEVREK